MSCHQLLVNLKKQSLVKIFTTYLFEKLYFIETYSTMQNCFIYWIICVGIVGLLNLHNNEMLFDIWNLCLEFVSACAECCLSHRTEHVCYSCIFSLSLSVGRGKRKWKVTVHRQRERDRFHSTQVTSYTVHVFSWLLYNYSINCKKDFNIYLSLGLN